MRLTPAKLAFLGMFVVWVLLSRLVSSRSARVRYDGFQVWRAKVASEDQALALRTLPHPGVELWRQARRPDDDADLFIAPASLRSVADALNGAGVDYDVVVDNVQALLDDENRQIEADAGERASEFSFHAWQHYESILNFIRDLEAHSGGRVSIVELDEMSSEERPLLVLKIRSEDSVGLPETKPVIFIEGGMHAREWISPMVALYIASELATNVNEVDGEFNRKLLDKFDFHIIPVANPDGFKYTQTDRMWRKSRAKGPTALNWCPGVDLNRNFDAFWNVSVGSSEFPCAQDYRGSRVFSEPEARALAKYWRDLGPDRLRGYFSLHSYGQYWLYPHGYKRADPEHHAALAEVASKGAAKLKARYAEKYEIGSAGQLLYLVSGSSLDYVYGLGVKHSYILELRPKLADRFGFLLPAKLILPTARETWDGISTATDYIHKDLFGALASEDAASVPKPTNNNDSIISPPKETKDDEPEDDEDLASSTIFAGNTETTTDAGNEGRQEGTSDAPITEAI